MSANGCFDLLSSKLSKNSALWKLSTPLYVKNNWINKAKQKKGDNEWKPNIKFN